MIATFEAPSAARDPGLGGSAHQEERLDVTATLYDLLMSDLQLPLDGAPSRELALATRLDNLHQLLYMRGGIRPINSAVEELSKLLFLQIAARDNGTLPVPDVGPLADALDPKVLRGAEDVSALKAAFRSVLSLESLWARLPDDSAQPIWPLDEPFRLARADVAAEALETLAQFEGENAFRGSLDALGTAFDVFLQGRYDHSGGLGTYLTPHAVADTMASIALELVDPLSKPLMGPVFGDPCCGTGRFLIALVERLSDRFDEGKPASRSRRSLRQFLERGIFGADQSTSSVAMARVNFLAYGIRQPYVFTVKDSITDGALDRLRGSVSLILTNPPFGDGKYDSPQGISRTRAMLPSIRKNGKIDPALAFVARCLELLAEGGVCGIVLPDGIIDGAVLRNMLLGHETFSTGDVTLEACVSLPTATFALAGTVAKTSAVFFRKGGSPRSHVFIARADHVGYLKQAGSAVPDPQGNELPRIAELATATAAPSGPHRKTRLLSSDPLAALVARSELDSLHPGRLDPSNLKAREELLKEGAVKLDTFLAPVKRRRGTLLGKIPFISVLHVDDLGVVDWLQAEVYKPSTPGLVAHKGELLVSLLNPRFLRATVVPDAYESVYCSAEFGIFEVGGDPYGILALLQDQRVRAQLAPLGRGTSSSRRRIEPQDVLDLLVPAVDDDWLTKCGQRVSAAMEQFVDARRTLATIYQG